ncbi:hypothetical protein OE88DRAFT_1645119 [Heliocybe sulcata]|uniref:Uncharacterized protein n=1 Tax=Heliocybe sulcata TaxID=5364 RepID=A0A5C3MZE4_9AGAM|nr:hypothetical protein OE88DRAFT_1645119 [Heliocybe sulcata]
MISRRKQTLDLVLSLRGTSSAIRNGRVAREYAMPSGSPLIEPLMPAIVRQSHPSVAYSDVWTLGYWLVFASPASAQGWGATNTATSAPPPPPPFLQMSADCVTRVPGSPDCGIQPYESHQLRWPVKREEEENQTPSASHLDPVLHSHHITEGVPFTHLQQLIPGLSVAFHDASPHNPYTRCRGRSFTHVITISLQPWSNPCMLSTSAYGTHHLTLHLHRLADMGPGTARMDWTPVARVIASYGCCMTQTHLAASLDFLSRALPYLPKQRLPTPRVKANVVILAPKGMPELAMDLAANYLAWASEKEELKVRMCIAEETQGVTEPWRKALLMNESASL